MSQSSDDSDLEGKIFVGTPKLDEIKNYFLRQKRLVDIKYLEASPSPQSSPDLTGSFKSYLEQRKEKAREEKLKIMQENQGYGYSPVSSKSYQSYSLNDTTIVDADDTMARASMESFMENEKMCENTLTLNNVSSHLIDLTVLSDTSNPDIYQDTRKLFKTEETLLNDIEAPSFMFNNTSILSPTKNSPLIDAYAKRPSTIMEVTETSLKTSLSNKTSMSSYQTAYTRSGTESSEYYRTANEESFMSSKNTTIEPIVSKPKFRSFYTEFDKSQNMTKDSLDETGKNNRAADDITKDSLNDENSVSYSSGVQSFDSYKDSALESSVEISSGNRMNDTLEEIEFMLEQAQKLKEEGLKSPFSTPSLAAKSQKSKPSPSSAPPSKYLKPKVFKAAPGSAMKSPLCKSSSGKNSPASNPGSAFKRPNMMPPSSGTKIPQPSLTNKKFLHIASPIGRYINQTPDVPLSKTARFHPGFGSAKQFNFRDSESFSNENESTNATFKGSSLPCRAKTKSSAISQIYDHREAIKTPGGDKVHNLLANSSPTVTFHQGHVKTQSSKPKVFKNLTLDETAISEQSFADLSLLSGDVSVQLIKGVKRLK